MGDRYLIIGMGSIGRRHLVNLRRLKPQAEIAVLRSGLGHSDATKPLEANLQFFELEKAIAFAPQAAIVASPASAHVDAAMKLCEAGIHMLIEKPLSINIGKVPELIEQVGTKALTVLVGYNLRLAPAVIAARDYVRRGEIGRILAVRAEVGQYLPDWRKGSSYETSVSASRLLGGGPLLELSHELDYIYWIFGLPTRVTARGGRFADLHIDVEDVVELILEYDHPKLIVNVHLDFLQRVPDRRCRFIGSDGNLLLDLMNRTTRIISGKPTESNEERHDRHGGVDVYTAELIELFNCIDTGSTTMSTLTDAFDVLKIINAAERSMNTNTTVELQ